MRAERLVAIALLLQAHRRLTVPELARRLDVSERTIRRDLEALLLSGLPLYSERGRGGGWALLDGPAIDLSALTTEEAQALFLVAGPELLAGLGMEQGITSAVRKLLASLPANTRQQADRTRQAIHIDPTRWGRSAQPAPASLAPLRDCVIAGVQVDITYSPPAVEPTVHRVQPYGLVSKSGVWYLMAGVDTELRTFRVSRIIHVDATSEPVVRPDGFDLARAWEDVTRRQVPCWRSQVEVEFQVRPEDLGRVIAGLPEDIEVRPIGAEPGTGPSFAATFTSVYEAACELIYLGEGVRVLRPASVRAELVRIGHRLIATHAPKW